MIVVPRSPEENAALCVFAETQIPGSKFHNYQTLGVMRDGRLAAVAVYHDYRHPDIAMSFASINPRWATRQTIRALLAFPFDQLKVRRVTAVCRRKNKRIRRLLEGVGFKLEGSHPYAFENDDAVTYGFYRASLEKLKKHGQKHPSSAASA